LAHEYGHFLHRDTDGGDVAMRVNATMGRFAMAMAQGGNAQWWNVGWQFVRLYHLLFRRITHGASRLQEINADRVAARAFGKEAFEEGLRHVIRRDVALRYQQAVAQNELPGGETATFENERMSRLSHIRADVRRQVELDLDALWNAKTSEDDTHPCPADRVRLIARLTTDPAPPNGGNNRFDANGEQSESDTALDGEPDVEHLFADPARIRTEREQHRAKELKEHAEAKRTYCANLINQISAYLAEHPGLTDPLHERANVRMELRDYQGAVRDYSEAIRLDGPRKALSHYGRGLARNKLGEFAAAAEDLRQAIKLDRSLAYEKADGYAELAEVLLRLGDPAAAIGEYNKAIDGEPNRLSLYLRRALAHVAAGDHTAAEADYNRALVLDPRCAEALAGRARVRAASGRNEDADADMHQAISIEPELAAM
jgi:tetratricopeptide (TPR) repeat protein